MNATGPLRNEIDFYADAVRILRDAEVRSLVGGAYALREYAGVVRDTKDFDLFIAPRDVERTLAAFRKAGYRGELTFPHWLAKVHYGENFIDLIFRSGNGLCEVDDLWFERSETARLMGEAVKLVPVEEMIWQKAYIMERERFDGADIAHLLRSRGDRLDWDHLLKRFGEDWPVLACHLLLFCFIYPGEKEKIPSRIMMRLKESMTGMESEPEREHPVCFGTLLSRAQYLPDIERWGYQDSRVVRDIMSGQEIETWTNAIGRERAM